MGRRTAATGDSAPAGGLSSGMHPPFLFCLAKRETGRARSKRKERFGGSVCAGADLLPPAGDGWQSLAAVRDGNARPLGKPPARGSLGYIQLLFSLPLARWLMGLLQRADEGIGPYGTRKASGYSVGADALIRPPVQAAATAQAARSEAERAEREAGQMRPCTPTSSTPSGTGRQHRPRRR